MKVLVTGATGFLGSRAATVLAERGHEVVRLARAGGKARAGVDEDGLSAWTQATRARAT